MFAKRSGISIQNGWVSDVPNAKPEDNQNQQAKKKMNYILLEQQNTLHGINMSVQMNNLYSNMSRTLQCVGPER